MASNSNNPLVVENAREAMNRFKMETAAQVGVTLKPGYNGDITAKQAGHIGGQMVKKICPVRYMTFDRKSRISNGHQTKVQYQYSLTT